MVASGLGGYNTSFRGLLTLRDCTLFAMTLYRAYRANEACSLQTEDVYTLPVDFEEII